MQIFRYLRRFYPLFPMPLTRVGIALLLLICSIVPESAIATPTNKQKGCLDDNSLKMALTPYVWYVVFDRDGASINLRSEPTINSPVKHRATSQTPVSVREQVATEDGYCWLRVQVVKSDITGWVRGDLLQEFGD
ncbi:SH3 type 3 domain protein [Calothrix brevissima NIES-22]|nr:SH3 type 3 domain protein [Calothrix brevissima NIES-22]